MRFMSIGELRNQPRLIRKAVAEESVTLTSNGRPFAVVFRLEEDEDPADLERMVRQIRAQRAVSRIRARAREMGLDGLSPEEVEAEISAARVARTG